MTTPNIQNERRSAFFLEQEEFQGNVDFQPSTNPTINAIFLTQQSPDEAMEIDSCCRSITPSGKSVNTSQLVPAPCSIHKIELKFEIYPIRYQRDYQTPPLQPRSVMKEIANHNPNIAFYAEQYDEINKHGEIKRTEVKIEAKAKKDPQFFFPEILRSLTTVENHIVLHAKDLRLFSCELKDSLIFPLRSLMFCNRASDMALRSKWTIDYSKDKHDQKIRLQTLFQAQFNFINPKHLVTIDVWNKSSNHGYDMVLDHFAFTCSPKIIKSLIVGLPLKEGSIKIVLELSHPMTLKKKSVQITSLENNNPIHSPEYRESTIYRGRNNYDRPAPGVLFGNKFILLEMNATYEQLHLLLSRVFQTTPIEITYSPLEIVYKEHYQQWPQYMHWMNGNNDPFNNEDYKDLLWSPRNLTIHDGMILTLRLHALIDLGDYIKDQLLAERETYKSFLDALFDHIRQVGFERAVGVLEAVIRFLGQTNKAETLKIVYNEFKDLEEKGCLPFASPKIELHYEKAESIEITPYGVLVKLPEIHFGNMVSRYIERVEFDDENNYFMPMLRASIREENGKQLRWTLNRKCKDGGQEVRRVDRTLRKRLYTNLYEGFQLLGEPFVFYAASGSQQRECGMCLVWEKNLASIRNAMGDYSRIKNRNKLIAREGMATSQSMECPIPITRDMWEVEPDIKRGKYCFTDGSGRISYELMEEICKLMGIWPCIPAGFQFRFPGFKGMLYYDVNLSGRRIVFRESQQKHELGTMRTPLLLQIIMFCCPQTANFSANFLNIIDQNSKKQDKTVHDRIVNTCLSMNESFFKRLAEANIDEKKFRMEYLKLPFFFLLEKLPEDSGLVLHQEEFFLGNLKAHIRKTICRTISKNRIVGDPANSRSAHGSPDDLGLLPEGCIYFESSRGVSDKFPNPASPSDVWEGKVIVLKYPCQHPGDVQVVKAVKIKEYAGQRDKLIFSAKGHRPIFDMLSGSDNDGDIYVICKIEELMPSDNEVPMDYTAANTTSTMTEISQQERIETYLDCAEDDNMGLASICQLVKSDEHGLESVVANNLAKTTVLALDRPKSGLNPPDITRAWTQTENGEPIPPEFAFRRPDFKTTPTNCPTYKSTKLNGRIHRLNRQLNFLVETTPKEQEIKLNPVFVELYKTYTEKGPEEIKKIEDDVRSCLSNYNKSVLNLMNDYGLDTEAELFSGCHMSGRAFERDEDENSNSNITSKTISLALLSKIIQKERENFFNVCHTAGYMAATKSAYTPRNGENEEINVLKRNVIFPSDLMRKRAICAYIRCYEMAKTGPRLLSFAWIAYDVLAEELNRFTRRCPEFRVDEESFYIKLETKVQQMKDRNMVEYDELVSNSLYEDFVRFPLNKLRELYGELIDDICFVLVQWGISTNLLHRNSETYSSDVSRLVFMSFVVASGCISGLDNILKIQENSCEPWTLGKLLVEIFARLSSHNFGSMLQILYDIKDPSKYFNKKQIKPIYLAARQTYYYMSIHQDLETFDGKLPYYIVKERTSRIIEIPVNCDLNKVTEILKKKIEAEELILLRKYADLTNVIVIFRGSYETEEKLRQIVEIPPPKKVKSRKEVDNYYSTTVLERILK